MMFLKGILNLFGAKRKENGQVRSAALKKGVIKFFNKRKGFGFIHSKQTADDVFVHVEDLNDRVRKGDQVWFQLEKSEKGLRARNVELAQ